MGGDLVLVREEAADFPSVGEYELQVKLWVGSVEEFGELVLGVVTEWAEEGETNK